jgi:hypothetical protein
MKRPIRNSNSNSKTLHGLGWWTYSFRNGGGRLLILVTRGVVVLFCGWFLLLQATGLRDLVADPNPTKNHDLFEMPSSLFQTEQSLFPFHNDSQVDAAALEHDHHDHENYQQNSTATMSKIKAAVTSNHVTADALLVNASRSMDFSLNAGTSASIESSSTPNQQFNSGSGVNHHPTASSSWTVDILSIGSTSRLDYLQAQQDSFGSHISVRHFFNVTERDDIDSNCSQRLKWKHMNAISKFCKKQVQWDKQRQFFMTYMKANFARSKWLAKKANPAGWICAQQRPALGFYKVMEHYRSSMRRLVFQNPPLSSSSVLPDYLIIMDDDTYYNLELFEEHFSPSRSQNYNSNLSSSIPRGIAGCMVRSPVRSINFTFPYGGFGFMMSRGYLENMMTPIHCQEEVNDNANNKDKKKKSNGNNNRQDFSMKDICVGIHQTNHINEQPSFREGMSLTDLLYAYATNNMFTSYKNWTTGFCLHSDWYVSALLISGSLEHG